VVRISFVAQSAVSEGANHGGVLAPARRMPSHISWSARGAGVAGVLFGCAVTIVAAQAPSRSVKDGVYTAAQASRGRTVYEEKCLSCHANRMWGQDWPQKSVFDVYDVVKNFMPEDDPGSLSAAQTRDVIAYILQNNKLPAGKRELPEADADLKQIQLAQP
jgi:mono/diheme cytochrome c family protein